MKPNDELFAALTELLYSQGRPITFPIVVNRHKWNVELNFFGRDDGFEFLAAFTSPNGRRYGFYMTDMHTDVEIYSHNGHLVTAQFLSNSIPSWMLGRIKFLRNVLDEY